MRAFGNWPPGLRAVVAVAGSCLLMVLVAWATLLGPDEVFTGPGPRPATATTYSATSSTATATRSTFCLVLMGGRRA